MNRKQKVAVGVGVVVVVLLAGCGEAKRESATGLVGTWVHDVEETLRYVALVRAGAATSDLADLDGYIDEQADFLRERLPDARVSIVFSRNGTWTFEVISDDPDVAAMESGTYWMEGDIVLMDKRAPGNGHVCVTAVFTGDRLYTLRRGEEHGGRVFLRQE